MADRIELGVSCSVIRDGTSAWICTVEWEDGIEVTREVGSFHLAGLPIVNVATTEEQALDCLSAWVRAKPEEWRRD